MKLIFHPLCVSNYESILATDGRQTPTYKILLNFKMKNQDTKETINQLTKQPPETHVKQQKKSKHVIEA